ncbi:enoyl-CoA hydratase/isomerase family protein [Bosea sp. BK604]|uniref:enoyl-CoA hydratase/isomerase family protein n=1 Tax=Bosea sp. BK604 TaxID=2512180 RepID=UPI0010493A8F|nr:enoyl-CoA hydratase/isomerase family protein [Bosea sp. BK604]TCR63135.1 enoyl-CoA hydratase/3-hydroxypropionyl-coenzyme A dehydratase [Bosea sp. BK604]
MSSATTIKVDTVGATGIIRFARPDQLNAMSTAMVAEFLAALERFEGDEAISAVILTGEGKAFMAGADLKEYATLDADGFRAFQRRGRALYERIERYAKPVIAAVNGYALGGGFEMVLACDLVVARRGARMGLPEVKLGLVPGGGGTQRLTRKIGPNRAFELLATGEHRPAEDYAAWGLVCELTDEDVVAVALALAARFQKHPAAAVFELKRLNRAAQASELQAGLDLEAQALQALFESPDGQERVAAFVARSAAR